MDSDLLKQSFIAIAVSAGSSITVSRLTASSYNLLTLQPLGACALLEDPPGGTFQLS